MEKKKLTKEEIAKLLYKQNPMAKRTGSSRALSDPPKVSHLYETKLEDGTNVQFIIPRSEMGLEEFDEEIEAKFLRRWLI